MCMLGSCPTVSAVTASQEEVVQEMGAPVYEGPPWPAQQTNEKSSIHNTLCRGEPVLRLMGLVSIMLFSHLTVSAVTARKGHTCL